MESEITLRDLLCEPTANTSVFRLTRQQFKYGGGSSGSSMMTLSEAFYEMIVGHLLFREPRTLMFEDRVSRVIWKEKEVEHRLQIRASTENMIVLYECLAVFVDAIISDQRARDERAAIITREALRDCIKTMRGGEFVRPQETIALTALRRVDRLLHAFLGALNFHTNEDVKAVECLLMQNTKVPTVLARIQEVWEFRRLGYSTTLETHLAGGTFLS